ncbi:MAG: Zn-dependent protease with chaperone function [Halioglobus sp.]
MNFFEQQDIARRNTRLLVLLFIASVFLLIVLTNALIAAFLWFGQDYNVYSGSREGFAGFLGFFSVARFGSIGLGVTAVVALVVMVKWIQLSTGGKTVAESMGGTRILPQSSDPAERRVLNVVEEIALAANMPVPPVYVMNAERGINAFAAGVTPADAIVAVTRGTISQLKRHELQGVIAHEFSHILNGDMRLNIRLAAMLKGITFIGDVGHILLRSSHGARTGLSVRNQKNGGPPLLMLGFALMALGWLGGLAAGFIKAGISRQKEFLADASAVQYTRSPEGIGDALRVIGGYLPGTLVHSARAAEMSHIFFGQIEHHLWQMFATHPPLEDRIRRIDPRWDGQFITRKPKAFHEKPPPVEAGVGRAEIVAAALAASVLAQQVETGTEASEDILLDAEFGASPEALEMQTAANHGLPVAFVRYSHEPLGANALVFALLMSPEPELSQRQMAIIEDAKVAGLSEFVSTLLPGVLELAAPQRLPLLEMCLPALKSTSAQQYRRFKNTMMKLIQADARTDLYEWCLFQLVRHYLDPEFIRVKPSRPRYRSLQKVQHDLRVVLSILAHEGGDEAEAVFRVASDELGFQALVIMPRDQCSIASFSKAVYQLADCYPLLKPRVLKAMTLAASYDGYLSAPEREIIASMAAVMDCPVPSADSQALTS